MTAIAHDVPTNFAYGTVTVAPSPANSGTTMTLSLADPPPVPFNAVVWPEESRPLPSNAEVVRVTKYNSGTGAVEVMVRAQEGSTAKSIKVGEQIMAGLTAKTIIDLWAALETVKGEAEGALAAAGGTAAQILDSLNYSAELERARNVAQIRQAWEEASETFPWAKALITEEGWTLAEAESIKVNAGFLVGTAKAVPAAIKSYTVNNGKFRLVASINFVSGGTAGNFLWIGVSNKTGGTEKSGWTAIGMDASTGAVRAWYENASHNLGTASHPNGTYVVTIIGDTSGVSFTLAKSDRNAAEGEYTLRRTRAQVGEVKAAVVYNNDIRGNTGSGIGPLGFKFAETTLTVRTGVEGIGTSRTVWQQDKNGEAIRLEFPAAHDSRIPPKGWIIFSHGAGDSPEPAQELNLSEDTKRSAMCNSLLAAGFCIASSRMHGNTFGNEQTQTDLLALYEYIRENFVLAPIILMGFSAGGAASAVAVARRKIPVAAMCQISGLVNMGYYKENHPAEPFLKEMETAYGLEASWANFTTQVTNKGLDPLALPAVAYRGIPVGIFASPEDTTVPKTQEADLFAAKLEAGGGSQRFLTRVTTSGAHASEANFPAASITQFCEEAVLL